jgi:5-methyltetrahydrofolate--homocysteine methyltransferase
VARNEELFDVICKGNRQGVIDIVEGIIADGGDCVETLMESMIPAMRHVGDRFARNEVYVPEMLIAARAMQSGLDIIEPVLAESGHEPVAKVAIGTVKGDLHDIGKNMVGMMLRGAGFEVIDLGVDCSIDDWQGAANDGASAICCSALLTTTMPHMKSIVEHFKPTDVKVVIGGAPITEAFSTEIGADGYSDNANGAVSAVETCLGLVAT